MHVTQSTVSARIKTLEDLLGRAMFDRSKSGAAMTSAGAQFQKHALALVRVWGHAQLEVGLADQHRDHLSVGAELTLWDGFLLNWVAWLRSNITDIAVSAGIGQKLQLMQRLNEGTLDLAVVYRPTQPPGLIVEHLFDEEFVLVASTKPSGRREAGEYVMIDWGADVLPDVGGGGGAAQLTSGLSLELGSLGLSYLLNHGATGYFPTRLVKPLIGRGRLRLSNKGRRFVAPVGMVYPEHRDAEAYEPILGALRDEAARQSRVRL